MAVNFGKLKDIYKLQKEAREMQKKMKALIIEGESKDGSVVIQINGVNEIEEIEIDEELLSPDKINELKKGLKQAFKSANKRLQKEMAKDVDIDKMRGMLGM